jgi:hypothetical protein
MPDYPHDPVFHFAPHHDVMSWNPAGPDGQLVDNDASYLLGRRVTIGELVNSPIDSGLVPPGGWVRGSEPGTAIRADLFYAGQNHYQQASQQEALRQSRMRQRPRSAEQARLDRFALLGQPPIRRSRYARQQTSPRSTRSTGTLRPQTRPTPTVISLAPSRRLSSTRVSERPGRIQASRPEIERDQRRPSATFGFWLIVSLISAILAYKAAQPPGPSGSYASGLVYVTATGDSAQSITWWFFGSCLSLLLAVGCFIGNLREERG